MVETNVASGDQARPLFCASRGVVELEKTPFNSDGQSLRIWTLVLARSVLKPNSASISDLN